MLSREVSLLISEMGIGGGELTNSDTVAESTKGTEVVNTSLQVSSATEEVDNDWDSVGDGQEDDTGSREGIEGGGGTKVDQCEQDLDNHAKHHCVQWHIKLGVDLLPPLGSGDSTITSESPGSTGGGSGAADTADDGENHDWDEESEGAAGVADGISDNVWSWLARGETDKGLEVWKDKDQWDQEEETAKGVQYDSTDHGLWNLDGRLANFLTHAISQTHDKRSIQKFHTNIMLHTPTSFDKGGGWALRDNHAGRRSRITGVEQADHEGPAIGPARLGIEFGEHPSSRMTTILRDSENADDERDNTCKGPKDGESLMQDTGEPC